MPSDKVVELQGIISPSEKAAWVSNLWDNYNQQRQPKINEWAEISKYLFATDTSTTSNQTLPWTHSTTLPKLTQIRDNLHSNYISSLFPNDKWLTWVAFDADAAKRDKSKVIRAYMENKTREGGFREKVSRLLYDYIDTGNAFAIPSFEARYKKSVDGQKVASFIGPKANRIDPKDIVFNPLASDFSNTFKVVRSIKTLGELRKLAMTHPEHRFWEEGLEIREGRHRAAQTYSADDWAKASQYQVDGFGNLQEYYQSDSVEILEFFGDYHDSYTGEIHVGRMLTIMDRSIVVRDEELPSYDGQDLISHVGWRLRPDNLWAMGPLDNLVGMQYMLDHYLNMGANALDLKVMAPKKIIGDVEAFVWGPNEEIHIDAEGDVQEMAQNFGDVMTVRDWITELENRMEMYAGAPREAMGIRTPGEKTAFEVQALENAAGRIFQEKVEQFELFLEKLLNDMLHVTHKNMDYVDVIRVIDDDVGAEQFKDITKEDITANGVLRPVGARHFAQKAQELQNLVGIFNSPLGEMVMPHTSSKGMADFIEDVVNLSGYEIFQKNIAVSEAQELQSLSNQAMEDNEVNAMTSEEELMEQEIMNETTPT